MNKQTHKLIRKLLVGLIVLTSGNILYIFLQLRPGFPRFPYMPYVVSIFTYTLIGALKTPTTIINSKVVYCITDIILLLLLLFPFIFPRSLISIFLIDSHINIFFALSLGYYIKLTILILKTINIRG